MKAQRKLLRKAEALHAKGRIKDSVYYYRQAISKAPNDPETLYSCGIALIAMRDFQGGVDFLEHAIQYDRDSVTCWYNLGMAYDALADLDNAKRCYDEAIRLNPSFILAHTNLGSIYYRLGDKEKGYYHHSKALEPETANDEDKAGRALIRLLRGDYEKGWEEYESRWTLPAMISVNPMPKTGRRWRGEPLDGKPLLIWHEQGLGDTLMMVRYLDMFSRGDAIAMVQPSLKKLMEYNFGDVVERGDTCEFYWHRPFMSLASIFGPPYVPVPRGTYISAPEVPHVKLPPFDGLTVGIYWQGSRHHMNDRDRSCPFSEFRKLFQVKGVRWVSLQTPPEPNTLDTVADAEIYEMPFDDFTETAAAIDQCDLVISVDSAAAHLAGAMGKRVWLMVPTAPEFRWGLDSDTTPWYPNHKLYRRSNWKAWPEVIERIKQDLEKEISGR